MLTLTLLSVILEISSIFIAIPQETWHWQIMKILEKHRLVAPLWQQQLQPRHPMEGADLALAGLVEPADINRWILLVQALDDKQHCIGIYHDGKLLYNARCGQLVRERGQYQILEGQAAKRLEDHLIDAMFKALMSLRSAGKPREIQTGTLPFSLVRHLNKDFFGGTRIQWA